MLKNEYATLLKAAFALSSEIYRMKEPALIRGVNHLMAEVEAMGRVLKEWDTLEGDI